MKDLEAHRQDYEERGTVVLGMSVDTAPSKKCWAEDMGVADTLLLSDFLPHGEADKKNGVFDEKLGASKRAVFLSMKRASYAGKRSIPAASGRMWMRS